jgi:hypothetical protein
MSKKDSALHESAEQYPHAVDATGCKHTVTARAMKSLHNFRQLCSSLHLRQAGTTRYIGCLLIIGALLADVCVPEHVRYGVWNDA